ncbi:hypothetical protein WMY93_030299 [Mugilogobius chulae]|uniref:Uncharacterized protein n=1 Tax=Mugilogobius chulae TaxID=88201 RepID=A0AAW0MP85_9GOBI
METAHEQNNDYSARPSRIACATTPGTLSSVHERAHNTLTAADPSLSPSAAPSAHTQDSVPARAGRIVSASHRGQADTTCDDSTAGIFFNAAARSDERVQKSDKTRLSSEHLATDTPPSYPPSNSRSPEHHLYRRTKLSANTGHSTHHLQKDHLAFSVTPNSITALAPTHALMISNGRENLKRI